MTPHLLFGTHAHHAHARNVALALHEGGALGAYVSCGVDHYQTALARAVRALVARAWPALDRQLRRRRVEGIPSDRIESDWSWELLRTLSARLDMDPRISDWLWERSEWKMDRDMARRLNGPTYDGVFGVEHGALASLQAAKAGGKPALLAFFSPHHDALNRWVHAEYEHFPSLLTADRRAILEKEPRRARRKQAEALLADFIHVNSSFTAQTLVDGGIAAEKIHVVPLGCPPVVHASTRAPAAEPVKVMYAGSASIRKGFHYLMEAWPRVAGRGAELHCYGRVTVPDRVVQDAPASVVFHGSVPQEELFAAFAEATVLVLPTLLDGFGMVVSEALAHGVPVVTTSNAGAADLVREGENGFIVPPRDAEALADRLAWCIEHPRAMGAMREAARDTAAAWTWSDFRAALREQLAEAFGWTFEAAP